MDLPEVLAPTLLTRCTYIHSWKYLDICNKMQTGTLQRPFGRSSFVMLQEHLVLLQAPNWSHVDHTKARVRYSFHVVKVGLTFSFAPLSRNRDSQIAFSASQLTMYPFSTGLR